jgi:hypothetical protein
MSRKSDRRTPPGETGRAKWAFTASKVASSHGPARRSVWDISSNRSTSIDSHEASLAPERQCRGCLDVCSSRDIRYTLPLRCTNADGSNLFW